MTSAAPSYLAFDLGASSGRAVVGTLVEGVMHLEEVHRFDTPLIEDGARLYWNLAALEQAVDEGLRHALAAAPELKSLSVDAWGVDYVPLDADGEPLRNPYSYRDPRTRAVMERALERVSADEIYATTGIQFMPINTLYQVLADREMEPERVAQTAQRLPIADYLNYRFSGQPVAERSMASTTQLYDVRTRRWATDLMARFDIAPDAWPDIVPSATKLGSISPFKIQNPKSPIEVIASCSHDTACAVAAVPAVAGGPSWAYVSCGTWSLLGVERSAPLLSGAAREAGFTNEVGLGDTVRFLKNLTGLWVLQECERAWMEEGQEFDHDALQHDAAQAVSLGTVDLDDARFLERGQMPAKLGAYCREHGQPAPTTRGEVVRLILESLAADYRDKLTLLEDVIGERIEVVHLVGGGANNALLCQLAADACNRTIVAGPVEATALGNLLIQARAMGDLPSDGSVREVARRTSHLNTYHPRSVKTENA